MPDAACLGQDDQAAQAEQLAARTAALLQSLRQPAPQAAPAPPKVLELQDMPLQLSNTRPPPQSLLTRVLYNHCGHSKGCQGAGTCCYSACCR